MSTTFMNWDSPEERYHLMNQVGIIEYERRQHEHMQQSIIATVNGHPIRPVQTRFGRLFAVGGTPKAFRTLAEAKAFAAKP